MSSLVKAQDFFGQMQAANGSFRLLDSNIGSNENLFKGTFRKTVVREGLTLHYSDVTNLHDLETRAEAPAHLGIKLFFQGGVSASIGDLEIPMPQRQPKGEWQACATLFNQKEPELFKRRAGAGDRVRKLTVKILPDWLESGYVFGDASAIGLRRFASERLSSRSWIPSHALLSLAAQIIKPPAFEPHLGRLYIESRVLGIIAEAFGLLSERADGAYSKLSASEHARLRRAEELLAETEETLTLETIATKIGASVNTLQRLFHAGHGTTVFDYIRTQRLERARLALESDSLSIAQAAYLAGYTSAANFSTAFKRKYGFSPKQSRK